MMARALFALAFALAAFAAPAYADEGWGADIEVMADDDMGDLRGGLGVAPGIEVNFGAVITTYVNGSPALTTNLTWTDTGQMVSETIGAIGQSLNELTPEQRAALSIDGLGDANGVVINDADGVTALVHNITDGALQNIIVNTAAGRDLRQDVDVTLTLPGFEAVQASILLERIGIRLDEDMRGVRF